MASRRDGRSTCLTPELGSVHTARRTLLCPPSPPRVQFQGPELGFAVHGAPQMEGPKASIHWLWGEIRDMHAWNCCSFPVICLEAVLLSVFLGRIYTGP